MTMCKTYLQIDGTSVKILRNQTVAQPDNNDRDAVPGYALTDCSLTEELLKPIEFHFILRRIRIDKSDNAKAFSIASSLLGKKVKCTVATLANNLVPYFIFEGTIVSASMDGLNITCVARSPISKLQGPAKCRTFLNQTLSQIVDAVASEIAEKTVTIHEEIASLTFPYIVQYNESDYDFLVRLAKRFGVFFYEYAGREDNTHFVFGQLPSRMVVDLTTDLRSPYIVCPRYEVQTGDPVHFYMAHNYEKNLDKESTGAGFGDANDATKMKMAVDASAKYNAAAYSRAQNPLKKYYIDYPYSFESAPDDYLTKYNGRKLFSEAERMVTCKFLSYLFDLHVGNIVKIDNRDLLVVSSAHFTWDCNGSPQNEITAFALPNNPTVASVEPKTLFAPYMDFDAYPKSSAQRAVVTNNTDALMMGRVQVQFAWQKDVDGNNKKDLPWIRIAQPYVGDKSGCYILPEVGEEVMVGFEHDNLEKPYVLGSLYHGADGNNPTRKPDALWVEPHKDDKQNDEGNEVKAFRTKKGHTIEFHDVDEEDKYGFIRIYGNEKKDGPNYDIILSTDKMENSDADDHHYSIKSADDQATTTKEIKIDKEYKAEKLRLLVKSNGGDIMLDAGDGNIYLNAKNIHYSISGSRTTYIKEKDITSVGGDRFVDVIGSDSLLVRKKQDVLVKEDATAKHEGAVTFTANKAVNFKAQSLTTNTEKNLEIKAANIQVEAKQNTTIKAESGINLNGGSKVDLSATNLNLEGRISVVIKSYNVTLGNEQTSTKIKGTQITLDPTAVGIRKGIWKDG